MPVNPPAATAPYPIASDVLIRARAITNDAAQTTAGNLLASTQPYTFEELNSAYEDLQDELTERGVETFVKDTDILAIPAAATTIQPDPGVTLWMSYTKFFDGVNTTNTPVLPSDMIGPLRMWERQNGTNQQFIPMSPVNDGLPSITRCGYLKYFDWINDKIYFIGATQIQDVRLRYNCFLPKLAADSDSVLIIRSVDAIAYRIAEVFARSRGSMLADAFHAEYMNRVEAMARRTSRRKQRGNHRRMPYSNRTSQNNKSSFIY